MKIFGTNLNDLFISFFAAPSQKRWLRSLEQEGDKIGTRIQEAQKKEIATLFARHIAPFIRTITRESLCASPLPGLLNKQKENRDLVNQYRQQLSRSLVQQAVSRSLLFAVQVGLLFLVAGGNGSKQIEDSRPAMVKPEGWESYAPVQKTKYIYDSMKERGLGNGADALAGQVGYKIHMHNRFIKPLLSSDVLTHKACKELIRASHPDLVDSTMADGTAKTVNSFIKEFCPSTKQSAMDFFNT